MKKLLLFTALASFSFASAQVTTNAGTFNKPAEGDTAFEMQFMPNLDGAAMFAESASGTAMMRSFKSETKATRMSATFNYNGGDDDSSLDLAIGYGIENHFAGAERLSTFWGYQGEIGIGSSSSTTSTEDDPLVDYILQSNGTVDTSSFSFGGGVFLGTEYYIIPKVYIGAEIGFGLSVDLNNSEFSETNVSSGDTTSGSSDSTNFSIGGGVTGMLRLGFRL